jgi:hypothetical protein
MTLGSRWVSRAGASHFRQLLVGPSLSGSDLDCASLCRSAETKK